MSDAIEEPRQSRQVMRVLKVQTAMDVANAILSFYGIPGLLEPENSPVGPAETAVLNVSRVALVQAPDGSQTVWIGDAEDGLMVGSAPPDQDPLDPYAEAPEGGHGGPDPFQSMADDVEARRADRDGSAEDGLTPAEDDEAG